MARSIPRSFPVWRSALALAALMAGVACSQSSQPAPTTETRASTPAASAPATTPGTPAPALPPVALPTLTAEQRQAAEQFFKSKTIRIIVGSGAGGGFDTTARLVSRHFAKYIPGNPLVIVENMPGGGGMVAANHIYNSASRDGLTIGIFHEAQVLNQLTGAEGVQFDLRKYNWLGSSYDDPNVCIVRTDSPAKTFKEMIGNSRPIAVGGTGPGSNSYDVPRVLAAATGANLKAVAGYPTTNDVRIGVERGELNGVCFGWESVQSTASQWMRDKYVNVVVQNGLTKHRDLPDVPLAIEFAKDEVSKTMLRLVDTPGAMAKPFALPPGVDPGRVEVLRWALLSTYQDATFLKEAAAMNLHFTPKTAPEIQAILDEVLATPPDVVEKLKKIVAP